MFFRTIIHGPPCWFTGKAGSVRHGESERAEGRREEEEGREEGRKQKGEVNKHRIDQLTFLHFPLREPHASPREQRG